jgi:hypothetical protein
MLPGRTESVYQRKTYDAASHRIALTRSMVTGAALYDARSKMYSTDATVTYSPLAVRRTLHKGLASYRKRQQGLEAKSK